MNAIYCISTVYAQQQNTEKESDGRRSTTMTTTKVQKLATTTSTRYLYLGIGRKEKGGQPRRYQKEKKIPPQVNIMSTVSVVLPLKVPVRYDLVQPLASWLDSDQNETSISGGGGASSSSSESNNLLWAVPKPVFSSVECRSELLRLAALRNCLSENLQDGHQASMEEQGTTTSGLDDCCDYHATLLDFEKRGFPAIEPVDVVAYDENEDGGSNSTINLTWKGAFATKQHETHHALCWDRACTLWNIISFQSYLANQADKSTKEGCKIAISQYQTAASNIVILKELVQSQKEGGGGGVDDVDSTPLYRTVDFSKAMLTYWEKLFLALAQQTIYKLANLPTTNADGSIQQRQHSTLAYVIQAAAAKYNEALLQAKDSRLQSEVPKFSERWSLFCKAQSLICQARAMFHLSIDSRLKREHGIEIARLRQCVSQLKEAHGFYKSANLDISTELQKLIDLSRDRLTRAEDDNKTIYMDDIPKELPEIISKYMVKENLPLSPNLMLSKVPLFEWC